MEMAAFVFTIIVWVVAVLLAAALIVVTVIAWRVGAEKSKAAVALNIVWGLSTIALAVTVFATQDRPQGPQNQTVIQSVQGGGVIDGGKN